MLFKLAHAWCGKASIYRVKERGLSWASNRQIGGRADQNSKVSPDMKQCLVCISAGSKITFYVRILFNVDFKRWINNVYLMWYQFYLEIAMWDNLYKGPVRFAMAERNNMWMFNKYIKRLENKKES